MRIHANSILAAAFLSFCSLSRAQKPCTVLVVANGKNANSVALANYYVNARGVPASNQLLLNLPARYTPDTIDTTTPADYQTLIAQPIFARIATLKHIDYIVLCRNLPSKIEFTPNDPNAWEDNSSVDSALAAEYTTPSVDGIVNPYWYATTPFNSTTYGMYLVTRLDGWSWDDAYQLVDSATWAYPGEPIFLNAQPNYENPSSGYYDANNELIVAYNTLTASGGNAVLENDGYFGGDKKPPVTKYTPAGLEQLGGYYSWGSNDTWEFSASTFAAFQFAPGAIAETMVSTSAMNLRYPQPGESNGGAVWNQSQIATLIHSGVTGVKGYVAEPYLESVADPNAMFPNYLSGMNLAESIYSASIYIGWKDIVVGDPLCNPYHAN